MVLQISVINKGNIGNHLSFKTDLMFLTIFIGMWDLLVNAL